MDINEGIREVERLLNEGYGISITDVDEDMVTRDLQNGEEPQAIVDFIAQKYDLEKSEKPMDYNEIKNIGLN